MYVCTTSLCPARAGAVRCGTGRCPSKYAFAHACFDRKAGRCGAGRCGTGRTTLSSSVRAWKAVVRPERVNAREQLARGIPALQHIPSWYKNLVVNI